MSKTQQSTTHESPEFQRMRAALAVIAKCGKCIGCSQTAREAIRDTQERSV